MNSTVVKKLWLNLYDANITEGIEIIVPGSEEELKLVVYQLNDGDDIYYFYTENDGWHFSKYGGSAGIPVKYISTYIKSQETQGASLDDILSGDPTRIGPNTQPQADATAVPDKSIDEFNSFSRENREFILSLENKNRHEKRQASME